MMRSCQPCGDEDAACCADQTCNGGGVCVGGFGFGGGTCHSDCGALDAACCPAENGDTGLCVQGAACVDDVCTTCGGDGDACCAGNFCDMGLGCAEGVCGPCGGDGQACCSGGFGGQARCEMGLACGTDDLCAVPTCGVAGLPCCEAEQGDGCPGQNLGCIEDVCTACGAVGESCCPVVVIGGMAGAPSVEGGAPGAGGLDGTSGETSGTGGGPGGGFVNDGCPGTNVCGSDGKCAAP